MVFLLFYMHNFDCDKVFKHTCHALDLFFAYYFSDPIGSFILKFSLILTAFENIFILYFGIQTTQ
jgi:hypothetical protein